MKIDRLQITLQVNPHRIPDICANARTYEGHGGEQHSGGIPAPPSRVRKASVTLPSGATVFYKFSIVLDGDTGEPRKGWLTAEFNPSTVLYGDDHSKGCSTAVHDISRATEFALAPIIGELELVGHLAEAVVHRLDVACDFVVRLPPNFYTSHLVPLSRLYKPRVSLHTRGEVGHGQTLWVGNGSGIVRLYDRSSLHPEIPPNTMRFEVEARRRWLDQVGIRRLGDLNDAEPICRLLRDKWEWARFGVPIVHWDVVQQRLGGLDVTEKRRGHILQYLRIFEGGETVDWNRYKRNAVEKTVLTNLDVGVPTRSGVLRRGSSRLVLGRGDAVRRPRGS